MVNRSTAFDIELFFFVMYSAIAVLSATEYFRRRNHFLIRHRLPYLTLYSNFLLFLASSIIFCQELAHYRKLPFSCSLTLLALHAGLIAVGEYLVVRAYYVYCIFYKQHFYTSKDKVRNLPFLNSNFRIVLLFYLTSLHLVIFVFQLYFKGPDYYCFSKTSNCIIGTEWAFLLIHALFTFGAILLLTSKVIRVKENLQIKTEFIFTQISVFLVIIGLIPMIIWVIRAYEFSPNHIRIELYFGVNFYYIPIVVLPHVLSTMVWPIYLDIKTSNKIWPATKVYDEISMDEYLKNPENYVKMEKSAQDYFCVELLLFWKEIEEFKEILITDELEKRKKYIINKYINIGSELEINISSSVRNKILKDKSEDEEMKKVFDEAKGQMLRLILENVYNVYVTEEEDK